MSTLSSSALSRKKNVASSPMRFPMVWPREKYLIISSPTQRAVQTLRAIREHWMKKRKGTWSGAAGMTIVPW